MPVARALVRFNEAWRMEEHLKLYLLPIPKYRKLTRQEEWDKACKEARKGVQCLISIQTRVIEWGNNLKTGVSDATRSKLQQVERLELQSAEEVLDDAADLKLPIGYGRD